MLSIYYALFDSHVNYCLQSVGYLNQASYDKIEKLQNRALRLLHFKSPRESSQPLFIRSRILPVKKQLILKNCLFAFDFINNKVPNYFNDFLRFARYHPGTRQSQLRLDIPKTSTIRFGTYNIASIITKDWNEYHSFLSIPDLRNISKSFYERFDFK